ncbi:MAG: tyrosine--tRNA ligase [Alphaproteobacteria bacterium]|nr:tyrosine--tRNA ligase [Alphaproteobacteria bacterium]
MSEFKSLLLKTLEERGFIKQISKPEELDKLALEGPITGYIGFDGTADSLHVGSLTMIMVLRIMQKTGHRPIALMGGGTSMVGDPSFKSTDRPMLTIDDINKNLEGIKSIFAQYLEFGDGSKDDGRAIMANNADWLCELNYMDFLRDYGVHFSVNRMLSFEGVKQRMDRDQHLSFLEFNYMILQGYDFLELHRRYGCELQVGGSDQWGNILNGVELTRRVDGNEVFALTTPLLTTASGQKMGKSEGNAIWLNEENLPAYDYWQYWRNTEDADVGRFLRMFTELPILEIEKLEKAEGAELNEVKKLLATEVTKLARGTKAAEKAAETARITFETGGLSADLPTVELAKTELEAGYGVLSALVLAGLATSNGEARRHIKGGAAKINDQQITDERLTLAQNDLNDQGVIKLSIGKKKHVLIKLV